MPYFAVDDGLYDHPKFDGLSDSALALWVRAGSWCMRYLTDGKVPADRVRKLGYGEEQAQELVRRGLWTGLQDGFRFHEWLKHQESKHDIEKHRDRWREEKRAKRRAKSHAKEEMSGADSDTDSGAESACPNPTQPNPSNSSSSKKPRQRNEAYDNVVAVLRTEYAAAYPDPKAQPGSFNGGLVQKLVKWAGSDLGPLRSSLKAYLADPYWASEGHPFATWAGDPAKYLRKAGTGAGAPPQPNAIQARIDAFRAEKRRYCSGPGFSIAEQHRIDAEIQKLERQLPQAAAR